MRSKQLAMLRLLDINFKTLKLGKKTFGSCDVTREIGEIVIVDYRSRKGFKGQAKVLVDSEVFNYLVTKKEEV